MGGVITTANVLEGLVESMDKLMSTSEGKKRVEAIMNQVLARQPKTA